MRPPKFEPLLASALKNGAMPSAWPVYGSPKLDGIRAINFEEDGLLSRKLKAIPNEYVQGVYGSQLLDCLDGELIMGDPTAPDAYRKTMSAVMSADGEPDVTFYVFDYVKEGWPYHLRKSELEKRVTALREEFGFEGVVLVEQVELRNEAELAAYEEKCLALGYEGIMIRSINGEYKFGRSTVNEGTLLKVKRFLDAEAEIIGVEELQHNQNVATTNELGRTKRSSHKAGKAAGGTLGALVCRTPQGVTFGIGSGFDVAERARLWGLRATLPGQLVKYRYFPSGSKEAPRFPTYLGLRSHDD